MQRYLKVQTEHHVNIFYQSQKCTWLYKKKWSALGKFQTYEEGACSENNSLLFWWHVWAHKRNENEHLQVTLETFFFFSKKFWQTSLAFSATSKLCTESMNHWNTIFISLLRDIFPYFAKNICTYLFDLWKVITFQKKINLRKKILEIWKMGTLLSSKKYSV